MHKASALIPFATLLLTSLISGVAPADPPDYILLDRCVASSDESYPPHGGNWAIPAALVHIEDSVTGGGGWSERHYYQYTAYAYTNGPNGYAEYGTGDDLCLGDAGSLGGTLRYEVVASAPDAASGSFSLTDSPSGQYGSSWNVAARINQSFDLTGYLNIRLLFFHHHQFRWSSASDRGYIEVNTGSGWTAVDPDDTPGTTWYEQYLGDSHQYRRGGANLSSLVGQPNVQIRFRIQTDASSQDDGWFIDDVRLIADGNTIFFDDFESGTGNWVLEGSWGTSLAGYSYESDLGTIDDNGLYHVTPVTTPVSVGEGMGYNAAHAAYIEFPVSRHAYAKVYHTGPQYIVSPPTGVEDICPEAVAVDDPLAPVHRRLWLSQNSPNPFNPMTRILFRLSRADRATLRVYDQAGRLVRSLLEDEPLSAGEHLLSWDGRNERGDLQSPGVYLYRLDSAGQTLSRSMVMMR
jgi:hypothetical protein